MNGKSQHSMKVWLSFSLLLVLLAACFSLCIMLYLQRENNTLAAFKSGRFVKVLIESGAMEGHALQSDIKAKPTLTREEYKQQRIKDIVVEAPASPLMPPPSLNDDAPLLATELPNPEILKNKVPLKLVERDIAFPLTLGVAKVGVAPWRAYAKPYNASKGARLLSIVITNAGINPTLTQRMLSLDEWVTLAFSPYAPMLRDQIAIARASGLETWVNLPLQHENYPIHDYGPLTLLAEETFERNLEHIATIIESADGMVGLLATPDEKFSQSTHMPALFSTLTQHGVLLALYNQSFVPKENEAMLLHARPYIDSSNLPVSSEQLFSQTEAYLNTNKSAILTLAPMPAVMDALDKWIATLPARNIVLVPLSAHAVGTLPSEIPTQHNAEGVKQ